MFLFPDKPKAKKNDPKKQPAKKHWWDDDSVERAVHKWENDSDELTMEDMIILDEVFGDD